MPQPAPKPRQKRLKVHSSSSHIATRLSSSDDPFFEYKPANPSDINLLAINNFRFATPLYMYGKLNKEGQQEGGRSGRSKHRPTGGSYNKKQHPGLPQMQQLHQLQQIKQLQQLQQYQQMQAQQRKQKKNPLNIVLDLFPGNTQQENSPAEYHQDYQEYHQRNSAKQRPPLHVLGLPKSQKPNKMVVHLNMHPNNINEQLSH